MSTGTTTLGEPVSARNVKAALEQHHRSRELARLAADGRRHHPQVAEAGIRYELLDLLDGLNVPVYPPEAVAGYETETSRALTAEAAKPLVRKVRWWTAALIAAVLSAVGSLVTLALQIEASVGAWLAVAWFFVSVLALVVTAVGWEMTANDLQRLYADWRRVPVDGTRAKLPVQTHELLQHLDASGLPFEFEVRELRLDRPLHERLLHDWLLFVKLGHVGYCIARNPSRSPDEPDA
jgi:hypothetical protein